MRVLIRNISLGYRLDSRRCAHTSPRGSEISAWLGWMWWGGEGWNYGDNLETYESSAAVTALSHPPSPYSTAQHFFYVPISFYDSCIKFPYTFLFIKEPLNVEKYSLWKYILDRWSLFIAIYQQELTFTHPSSTYLLVNSNLLHRTLYPINGTSLSRTH